MAQDDPVPGVRAVKALTRFHFVGAHRRKLSRSAARDRKGSASWGWHENVVGVGVGWKRVDGVMVRDEYCVTFFVLRKEPKKRLLQRQRIPERLELESASAIITTDVVQLPGRCVAHAGPTLKSRMEMGHARGGLGTLGLIVRKIGTTSALALSCSHAIARAGDLLDFGKSVVHPAGSAGATVGSLTDDVSKLRSGTLATFDVALARLSSPAVAGILGSTVVPTKFSTKLAKDFKPGTKTVLFGAVSGEQRGEVDNFQSTFDIAEMPFVAGHVEFSGLVGYKTRSAKGDSGGLVMSGELDEQSTVIGIHTAGRSDGELGLFQPIGPIMAKFGLELMP